MRIPLLAIAATCLSASPASAKYRMPPMEEILRTAPVIVDATVSEIGAKTGIVHLVIHHEFRGGTGAKKLALSKTYLTCVGGPPGFYGMEIGKRYVFILQAADTLYEGSTFYPVTAAKGEPDSWRVLFPRRPLDPGKPQLTLEEFAEMLVPSRESPTPAS